ncbi:MAG: PorT family protein [Bacteroidota bacterium]|nr:PorT family protein [Bacteroidota bacterium]
MFKDNIAESTLKNNDSSLYRSKISHKNDTNKIASKNLKTYVILNAAIREDVLHKRKSSKSAFFKKGALKADIKNAVASESESQTEPEDKNLIKLQNGLPGKQPYLAIDEDDKTKINIAKSGQANVNKDSLTNHAESKKSQADTTNPIINSKKLIKPVRNRKWNLGITFLGGESMLANNPLGKENNNNSDYLSSPTQNSAGGTPTYFFASKPKNSFAFIAGVFAEKSISDKKKIMIGINYKYFSTTINVGNKIDSIRTAYGMSNGSNNVKNYRNNFSFLEVPLSLKFQLGNSKSLPVFWNAGINISRLISSNALQFQNNSGVYYIDNSMFNKTQISFSTGFSAVFFNRVKYPISIGPYFYYSASQLANEGLYAKKHLSFAGISTEILLRKK